MKDKYLFEKHKARINQVIDYIFRNIDEDFTLEKLASIAGFSPFHFHRIFKDIMNETLNNFIKRTRIEKAAQLLIVNPKKTISEITYDLGFSSLACFARDFRDHFGTSASRYRMNHCSQNSNNRKINSKPNQIYNNNCKTDSTSSNYIDNDYFNLRSKDMKFKATAKELPEYNVAYIRHIGDYFKIGEAFEKLFKWAGPRNLINFKETKVIGVYYDNPKITEAEKRRSDACITVPETTLVDGEVGMMTVPGGLFAVGSVEVVAEEIAEAWDMLVGEWIPDNGYQSDNDRMCYELYLNDHKEHPEKKFIMNICSAIKPL